jgi:SAM-dependent methyltransferase
MSQAAELSVVSSRTYGNYILRTGTGLIGDLELVYGEHWYRTRFAGKKPILDLGPGRCWFSKQNREDIVAVDNAPELVENYRREGINIHLGSAYEIPFPSEYFEGIFCCWLLEHLTEPDRALVEMYRVLKPGGYACVIVPSPRDMVAFYDDYTHVRPFTAVSLIQLAQDTGFAKSSVECLPWARGVTPVLCALGRKWASQYLRFSDAVLRPLHVVNRNHVILDAWK